MTSGTLSATSGVAMTSWGSDDLCLPLELWGSDDLWGILHTIFWHPQE